MAGFSQVGRRAAIALSGLVLLSMGCSVRIAPSEPPVPSATARATDTRPSPPPTPAVIPGPTVAWQMADLGALGIEIVAMLDIAATRDGLLALGAVGEPQNGIERRLLGSPDGVTWRLLDGPADALDVRLIEEVDGVVWVLARPPVGEQQTSIWTTDDGETWNEIEGVTGLELGVGRPLQLAAADGNMLLLAHRAPNPEEVESVVLRTDDGARWADVPPVRPVSWGLHTLAGGESGYVVTYTNGASPGGIHEAWFSADGVAWTAHELPGTALGASFRDATAAHGRFVVVGRTFVGEDETPAVWSSDDGRTWTHGHPELGAIGSVDLVFPTVDGFVGFGWLSGPDFDRSRSWWSPDGESWVAAGDLPLQGYAMAGVAWQERLIAVGGVNGADRSVTPAIWVGEPRR
jgi:hypothetical protein